MDFKDRIVWITGASSGIGEALVYELDKRGAKLIISARRESVLLEVKAKCIHPDNVQVLPLDLEHFDDLSQVSTTACSFFGKIDILVNNGGISQRSLAKDTDISVDERLMKVNYLGTVALTKAVLPSMLANKQGQIVTVSSMVGKFGTPLRSSYAATKHALHGFMDSLRAEEERNGINITMICPGFVATNISLNALTSDGSAQNTMDAQTKAGIHPSVFAKKMANAILAKKEEVYIAGVKEKFGLVLKRFFPTLFSKVVKKMAVT